MNQDHREKPLVSFRKKLTRFGLFLVALVALPFAAIEIQRPWDMLRGMVDQSETLLSGLAATMEPGDLARMNRLAKRVTRTWFSPASIPDKDTYEWASYSHAFGLLLDYGELLPEEEVLEVYDDEDLEFPDYSYDLLEQRARVWERELARDPGLLELFRSYRQRFIKARGMAGESGFKLADIYLIYDEPGDTAFFAENLAFMVDGFPWVETSFPGEPYNMVETDTLDWRASYDPVQGGTNGFHANKLFDPENFYLPEFDADEWGTWFTVWYALGGPEHYNTLNVDIDAGAVQKLMVRISALSATVAVFLFLLVMLVARRVSRKLTVPIDALVAGSEAVMRGETDHRVTLEVNDEFRKLITVFNQLVAWFREKLNLKEALSKLLSEELAEKAAKEGLVLGGQTVNCSIVFTDFAGFSSQTQGMTAEEVVQMLNLYFGELIPVVKQHGGFPDKYVGDAIIAIFGAPVHLDDHADRAVRCAVDMQRKMRELNRARRETGRPVFEMRIGINSGDVVAGAIGCDLKLEYTSIGETTNLAQRMEAACDIGHVLISENCYQMLHKEQFEDVVLEVVEEGMRVKGYAQAVGCCRVLVDDLVIHKNIGTTDASRFFDYSGSRDSDD